MMKKKKANPCNYIYSVDKILGLKVREHQVYHETKLMRMPSDEMTFQPRGTCDSKICT
jgi:hypothetical protein